MYAPPDELEFPNFAVRRASTLARLVYPEVLEHGAEYVAFSTSALLPSLPNRPQRWECTVRAGGANQVRQRVVHLAHAVSLKWR